VKKKSPKKSKPANHGTNKKTDKRCKDLVVLGAGLAGLSAASAATGSVVVLERDAEPGGLARSHTHDGFTFDRTGHWLHLSNPEISTWVRDLLGDQLVEISRRAEIHFAGRRIPYPFQSNLGALPPDIALDCLEGFIDANSQHPKNAPTSPSQTFADLCNQRLGIGIAQHFMVPYNTKLFHCAPDELDATALQRFVPWPSRRDVLAGAISPGGDSARLGYNAKFLYPRSGGIGALPRAVAAELQRNNPSASIRCDFNVARVSWKEQQVVATGGQRVAYKQLVSTISLPDLLDLMRPSPPEEIIAARKQLRAVDVTYWDIGLLRPSGPTEPHWIYFPDPEFPFYRVGSTSAACAAAAPPGRASYYVETSHPHGSPCPVNKEAVLSGLRQALLLGPVEQPAFIDRHTIENAYVVMDRNWQTARQKILAWVSSVGISSVGRYGAWTYDSMEGALAQGRGATAITG